MLFAIKNVAMALGLLALEKDDIPTKVVSNLKDETLSVIRHVLKTPGWIRLGRNLVEVKLERLDSKRQAESLNRVLDWKHSRRVATSGYPMVENWRLCRHFELKI